MNVQRIIFENRLVEGVQIMMGFFLRAVFSIYVRLHNHGDKKQHGSHQQLATYH